jgi:hypothetical protein
MSEDDPIIKRFKEGKEGEMGFERFNIMIDSESAKLSLLTDECANGIVLYAKDIQAFRLPGIRHPLTSAIVKFVVTSPDGGDRIGINKETMKPEDVLKEAQNQEETSLGGIQGGRPPICPGILSFFLLNNDSAKTFLKKLTGSYHLNGKEKLDVKAKSVMSELLYYIKTTPAFGIAAVVMENIDESKTLSDFLRDKKIVDADKKEVLAILLAQVTRLALILHTAHLDLHRGNVLVKQRPDGKYEVFIIDFGLTGKIQAPITDSQTFEEIVERDPAEELKEIIEQIPLLSGELGAAHKLSDENKLDIMEEIINLLEANDRNNLRNDFPEWYEKKGRIAQMDSWTKKLTDEIILMAYDKFIEMHSVVDVKLSKKRLNNMIRTREIPDLSGPVKSYYVTLCGSSSAAYSEEESASMCTIMGGKRKTKNHKKLKKTKKLKKSKKTRKIRNKYKNKN